MKRSDLKRIIKEEVQKVLKEYTDNNFSGAKLIADVRRNRPDSEDMEFIKRHFKCVN